MDKQTFEQQLTKLKKDHGLFKRYLGLMISANVVLVLTLAYNINRERIVFTPVMAPEFKMMISNNKASPEYLNLLSRNILDLLLNITPNNVQAQQNELMTMVDSKYRDELQAKLIDIATQVKGNNLSQNFYVQTIKIINSPNVIFVTGTLNQYIDKNISSSKRQNVKTTNLRLSSITTSLKLQELSNWQIMIHK
jgi:type IV conjugative transfer system protein TraE